FATRWFETTSERCRRRAATALSAQCRTGVIRGRVVDPAVQRAVVPGEDRRAGCFDADPPSEVAGDLLAVPRGRLDPLGTSVAHMRSVAVEGYRTSAGHECSLGCRPATHASLPGITA